MKTKTGILGSRLPKQVKRKEEVLLRAENIFKSFKTGKRKVEVLKGIDLSFYDNEMAIIYGPSGCGKSTLLHTMLGLEEPDMGRVFLKQKSLYQMTSDNRSRWRKDLVGIVFQQSNWIKSLLVWENVAYPLYLTDMGEEEIKEKALAALAKVDLEEMANKKPMDLSGGEQQRVQLARALVTNPVILVADEPTGNLDSKNSLKLMKLLVGLHRKEGKTIIMITHDEGFLPLANRRVRMLDGKIVEDRHEK